MLSLVLATFRFQEKSTWSKFAGADCTQERYLAYFAFSCSLGLQVLIAMLSLSLDSEEVEDGVE